MISLTIKNERDGLKKDVQYFEIRIAQENVSKLYQNLNSF